MANSAITTTPLSTASFLATLGVDTHIAYTDGGYANIQNVIADLKYLGITQVRDGISNGASGSAQLSSYIAMAQAGIHFTFVIQASNTAGLLAQLSLIDLMEVAVPGSVTAIEGPNEINNQPVTYNGVAGLQGALNLQKALYSAVHSDPLLSGVPVDYFTGYGAYNVGLGPDPITTPGLANYDTQHPYPQFGQAPAYWVARANALTNTNAATAPAVYTETGYSTNGVSPDVQAKYTLDLLMDTAQEGIAKTYLYDLLDGYAPGSPQGDDGFGLFDYTKAPKPVATAIHNLTTLLQDSGATATTFQPTALNYSISGLNSTGNSMVMERSDGTYVIAVWAEPPIWNNSTNTEINAPSQSVTVTLPQSYASVQVFDPLTSATAISSATNSNSVTIAVTDHPILIAVSKTAPTTTAPPTTTTASSGTLVPTSPAGTIGDNALVTYNWNPATQLAHFLAAEAQVQAGVAGTTASIVAIGDSTTRGFGSEVSNWTALSYPAELAASLTADGIGTQTDNFLGGGIVSGNTIDTRIALVGGASWFGGTDAGGNFIQTNAAGEGFDFTLNAPAVYDRVTISYIDLGSGSTTISLNGGPALATLKFGNTGNTLTQTIDIPAGSYSELSVRATNSNVTYIQGASFWNSTDPSTQVYNAGISGWDSGAADTSYYNGSLITGSTNGFGETAGVVAIKPTLTLIDLGINDLIHSLDTPAQTVTNISQMVANLRAAGSDVIIVLPNPFDDPSYATEFPALRAALEAYSLAQNVPIIDLSATYDDNFEALYDSGLMSDAYHPDATLYADIGSKIAALLASAIGANTVPALTVSITSQVLAKDTGASATDNITSNGAVTLSGTVTGASGTVVKIYDGSTVLGSATLNGTGGWTFTTTLASGTHALYAVAASPAGASATTTAQPSITVDTTAPAVSITSQILAQDTGASATDNITSNGAVTLSGTTTGASVQILDGTTVLGSATLNTTTGVWTYITTLAAGTHALHAVASDLAGNTAATAGAASITVDTTPPAVTITAPAQTAGTSNVALSGTVTAGTGTTVMIFNGSTAVGTATINSSGGWSFSGSFTAGSYNFKAIATDIAGNTAIATDAAFTVTAPVTSGSGTLVLGLSEDAYLGDAQFTVSVDGQQLGAAQSVTVLHSSGLSQYFTFTGGFAAGPHTVAITFLNDSYGGSITADRNLYVNTIAMNGATTVENAELFNDGTLTFTVVAPAPPVSPPPTITINSQALAQDTGASATDNITSNGKVTLSGTFSGASGTVVKVLDGTTVLGTAVLNSTTGTWSYTTTLAAGTHALHAVATDPAGNSTSTAVAASIMVDTTPPTVSIASQVLAQDTGANATDNITSNGTVTLYGTTSGTSVQILDGTTVLGAATLNTTAGTWSYTTTLAAGTHALHAVAADLAGNTTSTAAAPSITVDTTPPVVSITSQVLAQDTGASATDNFTSNGAVTLTGTTNGASVQIIDGTTVLGTATVNTAAGTWSYTTTLAQGTHTLHAVAADLAGNTTSTAAAPSITVDTTPPAVTIAAPVQTKGTTTVTLTGTVAGGTGATVEIYNGATALGAAVINGGNWSFSGSFAAGSYNFKAIAMDIAGNTAAATDAAFTVTNPVSSTDTVVLNLSEDAYLGDAEFTVSVDGKQIGGIQTVTAQRSAGQGQNFTLMGNFGPGSHTVSINYINDAYGGSPAADRNLYVNAITWDGVTTYEDAAQFLGGTVNYTLPTPSAAAVTAAAAVAASAQNTLDVNLSASGTSGNLQFIVSVDGHIVGGVQTVTALYGSGQSQNFIYTGNFGAGPHVVTVDFLSDVTNANIAGNRSLYVNSITLNGVTTVENAAQLYLGGVNYTVAVTTAAAASTAAVSQASPVLNTGDTLNLAGATVTAATISGNNLALTTDSGASYNYSSGTSLDGDTVLATPDGNGGTNVALSNAAVVALTDESQSVTVGNSVAAVTIESTSATAGALIDGNNAASTILEITGSGGTAVLNAGSQDLTVKLDGATTLTLNQMGFITADGSAGGSTITALAANQTLIGGAGDMLIGAITYGDLFQGTAAQLNGDIIKGFGGSDIIDITNILASNVGALNWVAGKGGGVLNVTDGNNSAAITLAGGFSFKSFAFASDGANGTLITYNT